MHAVLDVNEHVNNEGGQIPLLYAFVDLTVHNVQYLSHQWASNINCSTTVYIFDVLHLS